MPTATRKTEPSSRITTAAPGVRVSPDIFSGESQAIGQLGRAVGGLVKPLASLFNIQAAEETANAGMAFENFLVEEQDRLDADTNYADHRKTFEKNFDAFTNSTLQGIKNPLARSNVKRNAQHLRNVNSIKVQNRAGARLIKQVNDTIDFKLEGWAERAIDISQPGELERLDLEMDNYFESLKETGLYTQDQIDSFENDFRTLLETKTTQRNAEFIRTTAKTFGTTDEAIDYIENRGKQLNIPKEEITWMRTAETADRARGKDAEKQANIQKLDNESNRMLIGVLDKTYNVETMLRDPDLTFKEKDKLLADYKKISTAATPAESDFDAIDRVQTAIDAYTMGAYVDVNGKTQRADLKYARDVLSNNLKFLDSADRDRYQREIYEQQDTLYSARRTDGRYYLKSKLLTGRNVFGIQIPSGEQEKQRYENASIMLDIQLNGWRTSKSWPSPLEFYQTTQDLINKVKDPNFRLSNTTNVKPTKPTAPTTVIMVAPDGTQLNVPSEKQQLFKDNGYRLK